MNVANLQLEGLLMAVASINHLLVRKGFLTVGEIDVALAKAQANMTSEDRAKELSSAHRDATNFPIRLLQLTNHCAPEAELPSFSDLARGGNEAALQRSNVTAPRWAKWHLIQP